MTRVAVRPELLRWARERAGIRDADDLQGRLCHGIAAILDDNGLAMKTAYEW